MEKSSNANSFSNDSYENFHPGPREGLKIEEKKIVRSHKKIHYEESELGKTFNSYTFMLRLPLMTKSQVRLFLKSETYHPPQLKYDFFK